MQFLTPVIPERCAPRLTPQTHILLWGSCFADHIGERLHNSLPERNVVVNPNGTIYNPVSIANSIECVIGNDVLSEDNKIFQSNDGLWRHWDYSTRFTALSREELTEVIAKQQALVQMVLHDVDIIFITFSTDHVYYLKNTEGGEMAVANCHKQPARSFDEQIMKGDILKRYHKIFTQIFALRPNAQIVLTLSPYRYAKYGMHENALSKARLLLFIDELCRLFPERVLYFPAYEIVTDELRDYRFYEADMLHPSAQAIEYVWEKFREWCFDENMKRYADERCRIQRDLSHRPVRPDSAEYLRFTKLINERKTTFLKKWDTEW